MDHKRIIMKNRRKKGGQRQKRERTGKEERQKIRRHMRLKKGKRGE
jgi:hypothetical protein